MESSQVVGVSSGQKCSDTDESGWTMYIGSQICNVEEDCNYNHDHHDDHDDGDRNNENKPTRRGDSDDDDDDDSMASDASSGPIEQPVIIPNNVTKEEIEVFGGLNGEQGKWFSADNKKPCRQLKKARDERRVRRSEKNNDHDHHDHQNTVTTVDSAESQV